MLASALSVVMVALLAVFAAGAVWFRVRARKLGSRAGLVPAVLAGLAGAYFLLGFAVWLSGGGPLGG